MADYRWACAGCQREERAPEAGEGDSGSRTVLPGRAYRVPVGTLARCLAGFAVWFG
jgi:hypothetical protein